MGCDIHAGIEVKVFPFESLPDVGFWRMAGEITINRNYAVFAALGGVRAEQVAERGEAVVPIAEPRGIPEDASDAMKGWHSLWELDAHSASYVTLEEIQDWCRTHLSRGDVLNQPMGRIGSELFIRASRWDGEGSSRKESRLVFFFDN